MTQTRQVGNQKRRQWIKSDERFGEVWQRQDSQKGKEKAFIQRGNMNQQDGQRQSTRGRYLMEIKENRENQEVNRNTEETNHLDREKRGEM